MKINLTKIRSHKLVKIVFSRHAVDYWITALAMAVVLSTSIQLWNSEGAEENLTYRSLPIQNYSMQLATSMDEQKAALIRYLVEGDTSIKTPISPWKRI